MSSSFADSFDQLDGDSPAGSNRPFDDGYLGYDPRLSSQRFDYSSNFAESESVKDSTVDESDIFTSQPIPETPSPPPIYTSGGGAGSDRKEFSTFSPEADERPLDGVFVESNGPILPPPGEMQEEGSALREWRRQNAIRLAENEKREKELLNQIIDEADEYKTEFYKKRQVTCENNISTNREKEKVFVAGQEKFHAEVDKNYWKAIAELIPNEVATIEKRRGVKKENEKKASVSVIQGPKPGKPTDLSRMRQILVKLKHNSPPHLKLSPPKEEGKTDAATAPKTATAAPKPVAPNNAAIAVA